MSDITKASNRRAIIILIGVCFMQAGGLGAILDAAGVFFVPVCEDLGFARAEIAFYLTCYLLGTIVAMPFVGNWISRMNLNRLLTIMFTLVVIAVALMGTYNEPWQWWISGVVFGTAGSFIFVIPGPILITNWFDSHRGIAMGISMSFSGIGGAILSPVFTALIQAMGWRTAYFIAAIIMAAMVLPWTAFVFKLHPEDIGLVPFGAKPEKLENKNAEEAERPKFPGVPARSALKTVPFWAMFCVAGFVAYFAGFNSHLPGYAQSIGFDAMFGATLVTATMVGNVVEKLVIGWLNDKIGVQLTVYIQLVMVGCGLFLLTVVGNNAMLMYLSCFLFGAQNSIYSVSIPLLTRMLFGERDFPKLFAWTKIGTGVIGCVGPTSIALVYDVTGSFVGAFYIGVGVAVAAAIAVTLAIRFRHTLTWVDEDGNEVEKADYHHGVSA